MSVQEAVSRYAWRLAVVWIGVAASVAVVRAEEKPADPVRKAAFKGTNPTTGEMFRGDVLSGAEKEAFLKAHNEARKKVGLSPVTWSDDIADFALDWIVINKQSYLDAARAGMFPQLKHRPHDEGKTKQKYGENLAGMSGPAADEINAAQAVSVWLEEKVAFDKLNAQKAYVVGDERDKQDDQGQPIIVGHFTQIVWKNTTKIGAAKFEVTLNGTRTVVIVCNYDPPGNFVGQRPY